MKKRATMAASALGLALTAAGASATTLSVADITSGGGNGLQVTAGGGAFATKTTNGVTIAGVSGGAAGNEIDAGQSITVSSASGFFLDATTLGLLYDGGEFDDVQEVARLTGSFSDGSQSVAKVTNVYSNETDTDVAVSIDGGPSAAAVSATQATETIASEISLGALFGAQRLTRLEFTVGDGVCAPAANSKCTNPSDYGISSLVARTAVPGPGVLGLAAFALALIGLGLRRRSPTA